MIPTVNKWVQGPPAEFKPGQFLVYKNGDCELCGNDYTPLPWKIIKHTTLIEPHELDWLQSMATKRHLGDSK